MSFWGYGQADNEDTATVENDLSELVELKIRNQIDDVFYNTEYQRITGELDVLAVKKEALRDAN